MSIIFDLASCMSILIIILSIFQTIVGIGILVLVHQYYYCLVLKWIEVMTILLPLSIINSVTNVIYLKKFKRVDIDFKNEKLFFFNLSPWNFYRFNCLKDI